VRALAENKSDDQTNTFYDELERVFHHFPKHHMKILLGDLNVEVEREYVFKSTVGTYRLHETSDDTGVGIVNSCTKKNLDF
jgi:hypothetical protein